MREVPKQTNEQNKHSSNIHISSHLGMAMRIHPDKTRATVVKQIGIVACTCHQNLCQLVIRNDPLHKAGVCLCDAGLWLPGMSVASQCMISSQEGER